MIEEATTLVLATLFASGGVVKSLKKLKLIASLLSLHTGYAKDIWDDNYWGPYGSQFTQALLELSYKKKLNRIFLPYQTIRNINVEPAHSIIYLTCDGYKEGLKKSFFYTMPIVSEALFLNSIPPSILYFFAANEWEKEEKKIKIKSQAPASSICIFNRIIKKEMVEEWINYLNTKNVEVQPIDYPDSVELEISIPTDGEAIEKRFEYLKITDEDLKDLKEFEDFKNKNYGWKLIDEIIVGETLKWIRKEKIMKEIKKIAKLFKKFVDEKLASTDELNRSIYSVYERYMDRYGEILKNKNERNRHWEKSINYIKELLKQQKIYVKAIYGRNILFVELPEKMRKKKRKIMNPMPIVYSILQPEKMSKTETPIHILTIDYPEIHTPK